MSRKVDYSCLINKFRWLHYLKPEIRCDDFSRQEEEIILTSHKELGNRWVEIAKRLPGRSDNHIKNFFYAKVRKEVRRINSGFKNDTMHKSNIM